ncbi:MAG: hypothetical protein ACI4K7_04975 [Oscillospiraceae bacterium]
MNSYDEPFGIILKRYPDSVFFDADSAVRKCMKGISDAELSELAGKFTSYFVIHKSSVVQLLETVFSYMTVILMYRGEDELLKKLLPFNSADAMAYMNLTPCDISKTNILSMLMLCCLKKTDEQFCKRLIDLWIDINIRERKNDIVLSDEAEFIVHPLYPLMLTESFELVRYYSDRSREERLKGNKDPFDNRHYTGYVESAIYYRQKEFLKVLCDSGYDPSFCENTVAYILSDRANVEYISDVWEVRERDPYDDDIPSDKHYLNIMCIDRISLLDNICRNYGDIGCSELFRTIPPIDKLYERDLAFVIDRITGKYGMLIDTENAEMTKEAINKYTAENIIIVVQSGRSFLQFEKYLKGKNITYDLSNDTELRCFSSSFVKNEPVGRLVRFFSKGQFIFDTEKLSLFTAELLSKNSAALTKALVQKGAFSEKNIGEAIDHAVKNQLFFSLDQINKYYNRED